MTSLAYWTFNYRPRWEASSKEVQMLSSAMRERFDVHLLSFSFAERSSSYRGTELRIPLPLGFAMLPWLARRARRYAINHLFASPAEWLLAPRLVRGRALLTLAKDSLSLAAIERNADTLRRFRFVVVECQRHRELLRQLGLREEAIRLIRPGTEPRPYRAPAGPFRVLFATSPSRRHDFLGRGVHLLIGAAERLPDVRFLFVWRSAHAAALQRLIEAARTPNVEVRNGYIPDMDEVYRSVHATVLPGLEACSLKPCPHSALDSLANGRPVLVSRPTSIADIVERTRCGVVFEPTVGALVAAVRHLAEKYAEHQVNCHPTVETSFSRKVFLARYAQLYESML